MYLAGCYIYFVVKTSYKVIFDRLSKAASLNLLLLRFSGFQSSLESNPAIIWLWFWFYYGLRLAE